jgi:hypothetical protein
MDLKITHWRRAGGLRYFAARLAWTGLAAKTHLVTDT